MPFDSLTFPARPFPSRNVRRATRPVGVWLLGICAMLLVMIALGGATRLTGSGLSIMEWAPVSGVMPPTSEAEWQRLFALYKQIPQYALVNEGFGLAGFKHIFWLEWVHRLWGRLLGVAFVVPLLVFAWRGQVTLSLVLRLGLIFVLGAVQGAVGWFMVASGFFPDSTAVSPYRLVIHLVLALTVYAAVLWTALDMLEEGAPPTAGSSGVRRLTAAAAGLVALTIVAGGFVAGLKAGLAYNTFPLMDGTLPPPGYLAVRPLWRNLFENIPAVQFDHRVLATVTALTCLLAAWAGWRRAQGRARRMLAALGAAVLVQYALGVATLLTVVQPALATSHQAVAVLVLSAALAALHAQRTPGASRSEFPQ